MKLVDFDNPVLSTWLKDQGLRLDPGPYISDSYAASKFLSSLPKTELLGDVVERIFYPGRASRNWTVNREHGVPFLSSADIFQSDLSFLSLITNKSAKEQGDSTVGPGWTFITRSGVTAGRVTYSRLDMNGYACSEDVVRVVPKRRAIPAGYLYTFLASPFAIPIVKASIFGTSVKHIDPSSLTILPIPRLDSESESRIDLLIHEAMDLRFHFQAAISSATRDLFETAGLSELADYSWHDQPRDTDFRITNLSATSLRALNYSPRAIALMEKIRATGRYRTLGDICASGYLDSGTRFKRIDRDPGHGGVQLINQRQGFWTRPEGRWIDPGQAPAGIFAADGTVLIAAQGTLGESEVFGRALFVTGAWLKKAYTQHFLRVVSGDPDVDGGYLFAFLRSEVAFRILRSMSTGGKQQDIHNSLRTQIPVPMCPLKDRERIAAAVRRAHRWRDMADAREDEAFALLGAALREAAR